MKKHTLILFALILFVTKIGFSQNLILNPGFELGDKIHDDYQGCLYAPTGKKSSEAFNEDLWFWSNSNPGYYLNFWSINKHRTTDWYWYSLCPLFSPSPYISERFVRMKCCFRGEYSEGVRIQLTEKLVPGKIYTLRIMMAVEVGDNATLHVYFSKWGEHWASNSNNNQKWVEPVTFNLNVNNPNYNKMQWYVFEKKLPVVPSNLNELKQLILFPSESYVFLDNVELVEYCPDEMRIENTVYYIKEPVFEAFNIYAGYDVGSPTQNGNVIVKDGADITYKGVYEVNLEPGFETEPGAEFEAFLAPCGKNTFPMPIPKELYICINDKAETIINFDELFDTKYNYEWTPSTFLTDPYNCITQLIIPQGTFVNNGTMIYYLHVTDDLGNDVVPPVKYTINYSVDDVALLWSPPIAFSPGSSTNPCFQVITSGVQHYHFTVFSSWGYGNIIYENSANVNMTSPQVLVLWDGKNHNGNYVSANQSYQYILELSNNCNDKLYYQGYIMPIKSLENNDVLFELYDIQGRKLFSGFSNTEINYDILSPGLYILVERTNNSILNTKKVMIFD